MLSLFLLTTVCTALALPATSAEAVLANYRGVALGDSVEVVVAHLQVMPSDLKVRYERPTLVQEINWRPNRYVSGTSVEPDPLAELVLTFSGGRLARIVAVYDRERTQGLTNADLLEAFSGIYGLSMLPAASIRTVALTEPETIGSWSDSETLMVLLRERYPSRISLTITSIAADPAMQKAILDGGLLDASEAPAKDLARRAAESTAFAAREAKTRQDNKAAFKP